MFCNCKNKAFTLIEMIGVVIIIGMLLLIAFPATVRLIKGNSEKKFSQYYELVEEASILYSKTRTDDLGGVSGSGCIEDITLSDLISNSYIKEFDDEKIVCGSPSEFILSEYDDIDSSRDYVDIRIKNYKGKISTEISLICVNGKKVAYSNLIEKKGTCDKYVAEAKNVLYDDISKLQSQTDDSETYFITGDNPNNYILYSGKLWRAISYNNNNKTIKLISDEVVTLLPYDNISSEYYNSNIDIWLNNKFLSTLRTPDLYLYTDNWNYTSVSDSSKPANTNIIQSKVGLLNYYEFNKVKSYLLTNYNWWLASMANSTNSWYVTNDNSLQNISVANFLGIRPSIVLKSNVTYIAGGDGTKNNPYKLEGDTIANSGTFLNTRYAGEYVTFAGSKYRIIETDKNYTKLILDDNLPVTTNFDDTIVYSYNSGSKIGILLNNEWYNNFSTEDKNKLTSADFCISIFINTTKYSSYCTSGNIINTLIGIPRIGDMYTLPIASGEYWTLSNATDTLINTISVDGKVTSHSIDYVSGVRPVINISNNVKIASGNGTSSNPYILQ